MANAAIAALVKALTPEGVLQDLAQPPPTARGEAAAATHQAWQNDLVGRAKVWLNEVVDRQTSTRTRKLVARNIEKFEQEQPLGWRWRTSSGTWTTSPQTTLTKPRRMPGSRRPIS